MPTTSLLIPAYNAENFLPRLFKAVAAQSVAFNEVLVFDDASTDSTAELAESLGATVFTTDTNVGPGQARNELAQKATGDWIHFHDADDSFSDTFVEACMAKVSDAIDAIVCNADWVAEEDAYTWLSFRYEQEKVDADLVSYLLVNPTSAANVFYRRSSFLESGGFNQQKRCWEDADLNIRMAFAGAKYVVVPETLVTAYRQEHSISSNQNYCHECRLAFLYSYRELLGEKYFPILGQEVEKCARLLLREKNWSTAKSALDLARSIGCSIPKTQSSLLKLVKFIMPDLFVLYLQELIRARSKLHV